MSNSETTGFVAVMKECSRCGAAVLCDPGVSRLARHDYNTDCNGRLVKVNRRKRRLSRRGAAQGAARRSEDKSVRIPWFKGASAPEKPVDPSKEHSVRNSLLAALFAIVGAFWMLAMAGALAKVG